MNERDFKKIAPQGIKDLTTRVGACLSKSAQALCGKCEAKNLWVFQVRKTNVYGVLPRKTVGGPLMFVCNNCHKETRLIRLSSVGLKDDIEVEK